MTLGSDVHVDERFTPRFVDLAGKAKTSAAVMSPAYWRSSVSDPRSPPYTLRFPP